MSKEFIGDKIRKLCLEKRKDILFYENHIIDLKRCLQINKTKPLIEQMIKKAEKEIKYLKSK